MKNMNLLDDWLNLKESEIAITSQKEVRLHSSLGFDLISELFTDIYESNLKLPRFHTIFITNEKSKNYKLYLNTIGNPWRVSIDESSPYLLVLNGGMFNTSIQNFEEDYASKLLGGIGLSLPEDRNKWGEISIDSRNPRVETLLWSSKYLFISGVIGSYRTEFVSLYFTLKIPTERFSFLRGIVEDDKKTNRIIGAFISACLTTKKTVPPIVFSLDTPIPSNGRYGLFKISTGEVFWIPEPGTDMFPIDNRQKFLEKLGDTHSQIPSSFFIAMDVNNKLMYQTNSQHEIEIYDLECLLPLSKEDIIGILEDSVEDGLINSNTPSSVSHFWKIPNIAIEDALSNLAYKTNSGLGIDTPIRDLPTAPLMEILRTLEEAYKARLLNNPIIPERMFKALGLLKTIITYHSQYQTIKDEVVRKRENFNKASRHDLKPIPFLDNLDFYYPHQGEAVPKLQFAAENAILDIGTGGGKCVTGDTLIPVKNQGWVKISSFFETVADILHDEERIFSSAELFPTQKIEVKTQDSFSPISHFYYGGKQKIRRVTSSYGFSLGGSYDKHSILALDVEKNMLEYRKLQDIKIGDLVVIQYNQRCWPDSPKNSICSSVALEALNNLGKNINNEGVDSLPDTIMCISKERIVKFLSTVADICGRFDRGIVYFHLNNETVARQIQLLLANFGIISFLDRDIAFELKIDCPAYLDIFFREIGFSEKSAVNDLYNYFYRDTDIIQDPHPFIFFDAITKIEDPDDELVYDLSVPNYFHFISNCFVSHNTIILTSEMATLINKGGVKPLIVCPPSLIPQWISEIRFFSNNQLNAFAITTDTLKAWAEDKNDRSFLLKEALNAPPNTIFITQYAFLRSGSYENESGKLVFPNANWFMDELGVNYVAFDESQNMKNMKTKTNKACASFREAVYKRLASGTLISNVINDIVGQVYNIDPRLLGTHKEFNHKFYVDGDSKMTIVDNFNERVKRTLSERAYYLNYKEWDWAAALPDIEFGYHFVELTPIQNVIYTKILSGIMDTMFGTMSESEEQDLFLEFKEQGLSPEAAAAKISQIREERDKQSESYKKAWNHFKGIDPDEETMDQEESHSTLAVSILGMFAKLEQYITAPNYENFLDFVKRQQEAQRRRKEAGLPIENPIGDINRQDLISPKLAIIDNLIESSMKDGFKVIVGVHYKFAARHLYEHSKFGLGKAYDEPGLEVGRYYDAGYKANLDAFINDPNVKVIFAVIGSIKEGLNLQVANRVINVDHDWTSGNEKQLRARVHRLEKTDSLERKREKVYADYVIANKTADVIKIARLISKKLINANVTENSETPQPAEIPIIDESCFNLDKNYLLRPYAEDLPSLMEMEDLYNEEVKRKIEYTRNHRDNSLIPVPKAPITIEGTRRIRTPWVAGMKIPNDVDGIKLIDFLKSLEADGEDYFHIDEKNRPKVLQRGKDILVGMKVFVEDAYGRIKRIRRGMSATVIFNENKRKFERLFPISLIIITDKRALDMISEQDKTIDIKPTKTITTITPKIKPPISKPEVIEEDTYHVGLTIINGYPTVMVPTPDRNISTFRTLMVRNTKFHYHYPYWVLPIRDKNIGVNVFEYLRKKFFIPKDNRTAITDILDTMTGNRINPNLKSVVNLQNFLLKDHEDLGRVNILTSAGKKITKLGLNLDVMVIRNRVFFVVDKKTTSFNMGKEMIPANGQRFELEPASWYWISPLKNVSPAVIVLKKLNDEGIKISDPERLNESVQKLKKIFSGGK